MGERNMTRWNSAWIVLLAGLLTVGFVPQGAAVALDDGPATVYDMALEAIRERFGEVPDTATVNGETVPSDQALETLRASLDGMVARDGSGGLAAQGTVDDTGYALRNGNRECETGIVVRAVAFGEPIETLQNEETTGVPDGVDPCTDETATVGSVSADLNPESRFLAACVDDDLAGGWVNHDDKCIFGDIGSATLYGRVVNVTFGFCFGDFCIVNEQLRAGFVTIEPTTGEDVQEDVVIGELGSGAFPDPLP